MLHQDGCLASQRNSKKASWSYLCETPNWHDPSRCPCGVLKRTKEIPPGTIANGWRVQRPLAEEKRKQPCTSPILRRHMPQHLFCTMGARENGPTKNFHVNCCRCRCHGGDDPCFARAQSLRTVSAPMGPKRGNTPGLTTARKHDAPLR